MGEVAALARIRYRLSLLVAELYRHHMPDPHGPEWTAISEKRVAPSLAWYLCGLLGRAARPWQLVVAELAANAGRGCRESGTPRCGCPLCSGLIE